METLLQLISNLFPITEQFATELTSSLVTQCMRKATVLLKPGQQSDHIYFIETGLIRGYYIKDGRDITTGFMKEGDFAVSPASFFGRQLSYEYLELIEDSKLYGLAFASLEGLYARFPAFNRVGRVLVEQYYVRSELRAHQIRANTAKERYLSFLNDYRSIAHRISNSQTASFIGLTPETLSRVKSRKNKS